MWRCRPQWRALTAPPPPASRPVIVRATVGHARCASSLAACPCSGLNAATIAAADLARRTRARSFATEAARTPAKASQSRRAAKLAARASTPAAAAPAAATDAVSAADAPIDSAQAASESTTAEPSVLYSPLPKPRNNRASTEDLSRAQLLQLMHSLPSTYVLPDRKHMPSLEELTRALEAVQQYRRRYGRTRSLMGFREFGLCIDTLVWSTHKHAQLLAQQRDQQSTAAFQLGASASATHNVLQKLVKEAVTRGYLRGNLPTCGQVLDAFFAAGQYYRVLNLFEFLQSAVQADQARALQRERAEHAVEQDDDSAAATASSTAAAGSSSAAAAEASEFDPATGAAGVAAASIAADPPSAEVEEAVSNVLAAAQLLRSEHSELFEEEDDSAEAWYRRPHPLLHLDRHAYHVLMRAQLALGFTHQALEMVQHTMPQVALLTAHVEGLRSRQAWHRRRATMQGAWAGSSSGALMAAAVMPSTESYLLAFEAACRSGAHAQARDLYLLALRTAERDFHAALPRLLQFLHSGPSGPSLAVFKEQVALARRAGLPGLDQVLHQQVLEVVAGLENRRFDLGAEALLLPLPPLSEQEGGADAAAAAAAAAAEQRRAEWEAWASDGPPAVLPRGRALPASLLAAPLRDSAPLAKLYNTPLFPPAFLCFHRENFFQFVWCTSAAAPARIATPPSSHAQGGNQSSSAAADVRATQEALATIQSYLRNPTWMRTWGMGPPLGSGPRRSASAAAASSTTGNLARFGADATSSPLLNGAALLAQNPCATLEMLLRLHESRADHLGAVSLYEQTILPAIEGANALLVRRLLAQRVVHSLDHADPLNPGAVFRAGQRLRLALVRHYDDQHARGHREEEGTPAIFTITSVPPFLQPPIAALSPAIYNLLTNAYCQLAQRSGHAFAGRGGAGAGGGFNVAHFFCMLEERALMRTIYTNPASMQRARSSGASQAAAMWSHRDTALTLAHVASVLAHLPAAQWPLCKQVVDRLVRGVLGPVLDAEERAEEGALGKPASERRARRDGGGAKPSPATGAGAVCNIQSASSRLQLQAVYLALMGKYFSLRKYAHLLSLYELEHLQHYQPPLPLSLGQSLLVVQGYAWAGSVSVAVELHNLFARWYAPNQRVAAAAFLVHFLETHVVKAVKQQQQARGGKFDASLPVAPAAPAAAAAAAVSSSSNGGGSGVRSPLSSSFPLSDPFESLPLPSQLPVPSISSMGSPVVSSSGGPAYRSGAGFTVLPPLEHDERGAGGAGAAATEDELELALPSLDSDPAQRDALLEARKVEAWKLGAQARMVQRITGVATHSPHHGGSGGGGSGVRLHAGADLYDDEQFLVLPMHTPLLLHRTFAVAPLQASKAWRGSAFTAAPQGASFSFGLGSPAFSSYATCTADLAAAGQLSDHAEHADPMINYHLSQIHGLLTQLLATPALLHYSPAAGRCDLRRGVAYNQGRCVLYLLSLWIKSQAGPTRTYQFLLPRTMLRVCGANETAPAKSDAAAAASTAASSPANGAVESVVLSDLEHVILHSYSAEFLLSQYFPGRVSARLIERSALDLPSQAALPARGEEGQRGEPLPTQQQDEGKNDSFGVPLAVQPFALFTVQWP